MIGENHPKYKSGVKTTDGIPGGFGPSKISKFDV
jgi:hypothetical protein